MNVNSVFLIKNGNHTFISWDFKKICEVAFLFVIMQELVLTCLKLKVVRYRHFLTIVYFSFSSKSKSLDLVIFVLIALDSDKFYICLEYQSRPGFAVSVDTSMQQPQHYHFDTEPARNSGSVQTFGTPNQPPYRHMNAIIGWYRFGIQYKIV